MHQKFPVLLSEILFLVWVSFFAFPQKASAEPSTIQTIPHTLSLSWDGGERIVSPEIVSSWFQPTNTIRFRKGSPTELFSSHACPWILQFCDFALPADIRSTLHSETSFPLNETPIRQFLEELRTETRTNPIDAVFTAGENNTVSAFAPSRDGSELDTSAGLEAIKTALADTHAENISINIPTVTLPPTITSTDADRLGITQFLGEGRTSFAGSPKNRIFNIKRAIEQFQGVIIAPGEDFSFVKRLGEVDGEHGYLPELVIKRGKTEPEFGGGICQVSTTLFRAALNTGQKITERRNHAYPVSYYKPYGMDATVYVPKPDFRFTNNTKGHILIQVAIEGSELVFRFYGTPDGRAISIDGPHILESHPDGSMKTIFTEKVTAADGTVLIDDSFKSAYESPSKYPHPGDEKLTEKPRDWSEKQWSTYVKTGTLPR